MKGLKAEPLDTFRTAEPTMSLEVWDLQYPSGPLEKGKGLETEFKHQWPMI